MWLIKNHPDWARRRCVDCRNYIYSQEGELVRRPHKIGLPIIRQPGGMPDENGMYTPCHKCPKIPDGKEKVWWNAIEVTDETRQTIAFYYRCAATKRFPEDPIVEEYSGELYRLEELYRHTSDMRLRALFESLFITRNKNG